MTPVSTSQRMHSGYRIGPYVIASAIGAGGMGEVFRARDTRLNRDVAVKVLPKDFAGNPDRLRRFEQESKTLAALNHPNVLTVFDTGVHEDSPYLVSELLEGKTLREEIKAGGLALRKVTDYAVQIAQGLAAAHARGIIHRDLKPENIFITKGGCAKILDFGLAKLQENQKSEIRNQKFPADPDAPTLVESTEPGRVMGTPAYMSPEQVRGEPADQRTDIFAFGCVLYEMLTGTRAFRRGTPIASMNAILTEEPQDLTASNPNVSPALERIVRRCLEKQPEHRFQTAKDLAFAIETAATSSSSASTAGMRLGAPHRRWQILLPWALAGLCTAALLWLLLGRHPPGSLADRSGTRSLRKLELSLQAPGTTLPRTAKIWPAISPDGRKIAYATPAGLWLRWLDQLTPPVSLARSDGILVPFWSPQSTDVAYFDGQNLMRVAVSGQRSTAIATLPGRPNSDGAGGAWLAGDRVIFTTGEPVLYEVPAQGGSVVKALAGRQQEESFARATALPGGRGAVFVRRSARDDKAIVLWTLAGEQRVILKARNVRLVTLACSGTGHVLFDRWDGTRGIWAFPFSLEKLTATGEMRRISDVGYAPSAAGDGTLVCAIGGEQDDAFALKRLVWVDRAGTVQATACRALPACSGIRLSPDGQRAVGMAGEALEGLNIWVFELDSGQTLRVTQTPFQENLPDWWDEGRAVVFSRGSSDGTDRVFRKQPQAVGQEEILAPALECWAVSAQRKLLLGHSRGKWGYVSLDDAGKPFVPLPESLQTLGEPQFAPDGRQLAYRLPESGPGEIYVADFPGFGNVQQVSRNSGFNPEWNPNSTELFFLSNEGRSLMSARKNLARPDFEAPAKVFDIPEGINPGRPGWPTFYSVSPDGSRFLMLQNTGETSTEGHEVKPNAMLIENWFEPFREQK